MRAIPRRRGRNVEPMSTVVSAADAPLVDPRVSRRHRPSARALWLVVALYAASRVFSSALLALALWVQQANGWRVRSYTESPSFLTADGATYRSHLDFFSFSGLWDGEYYRLISATGYPSVLPHDGNGHILPNPWAFLPGYPALVRGIEQLTGLGFFSVGTVVSALFGLGAVVMLYLLVSERVGRVPALFAASVFSFGPLAFLLQTTYADSMFAFLMFAAMYLMQRRRYWWMLAAALPASVTRPGEIALAAALGTVFLLRLREARWGKDVVSFPVGERVAMIGSGIVTALAGVAWPIVAAAVTGIPNAYTATELSWRDGFIGHTEFLPFTAWFALGGRYLGAFGVAVVCTAVLTFGWWITRVSTRRLGRDILASVTAFVVYLLAVFMPQQSFFRVIIPAAPLLGDPALSRSRAWRWVILIGGALLQPVCIALVWMLANP